MSNIAAVILAAGRGLRYEPKGNKLLIDFGGRPLLRRVTEAAVDSLVCRVIVVTGYAQHDIEAALLGLPVCFVHNSNFTSGLASSLRAGLVAAGDASGIVVLLGDMLEISAHILNELIAAFENSPTSSAIVPTHRGQRGNPVLIARTIFPRLMTLEVDAGAGRLLREMEGVVELPFEVGSSVLFDVDVAADLKRVKGIRLD